MCGFVSVFHFHQDNGGPVILVHLRKGSDSLVMSPPVPSLVFFSSV